MKVTEKSIVYIIHIYESLCYITKLNSNVTSHNSIFKIPKAKDEKVLYLI